MTVPDEAILIPFPPSSNGARVSAREWLETRARGYGRIASAEPEVEGGV